MEGTEKQITWATEIRANIVKTFDAMLTVLPTIAPSEAAASAAANRLQACIDRLNADDVYAGDIIELFKDIRFNGDLQHDFNDVMAVYSAGATCTAGQRALLGR